MTPERITATTMYGSGLATFFFGLTAQEFASVTAAVVCVLSAIATIWITYHFKNKHYLLQKEIMERNTLMHLPTVIKND